jgi:F420-non-reducing hydrogenase large subunit
VIQKANLIVATQGNAARIAMSVEKAAKGVLSGKEVSEGLLNMVEMAFRAYDPCFGCATHTLPGTMPLEVRLHGPDGEVVRTIRRDG